jgi:hypothetical protein
LIVVAVILPALSRPRPRAAAPRAFQNRRRRHAAVASHVPDVPDVPVVVVVVVVVVAPRMRAHRRFNGHRETNRTEPNRTEPKRVERFARLQSLVLAK